MSDRAKTVAEESVRISEELRAAVDGILAREPKLRGVVSIVLLDENTALATTYQQDGISQGATMAMHGMVEGLLDMMARKAARMMRGGVAGHG